MAGSGNRRHLSLPSFPLAAADAAVPSARPAQTTWRRCGRPRRRAGSGPRAPSGRCGTAPGHVPGVPARSPGPSKEAGGETVVGVSVRQNSEFSCSSGSKAGTVGALPLSSPPAALFSSGAGIILSFVFLVSSLGSPWEISVTFGC